MTFPLRSVRPDSVSRAGRCSAVPLFVVSLALLWPGMIGAKPVPENLGTGVREVVQGKLALRPTPPKLSAPARTAPAPAAGRILDDRQRLLRTDSQGNPMVRLTLDGSKPLADVVRALSGLPGTRVLGSTDKHAAGAIEAFVPQTQLVFAARLAGVRSVVPAGLAYRKVGATTTGGVDMHRVDRVPKGINGAGITIGALSDSYNTSTDPVRASRDIASGDLPGRGNPAGNTQPIVVLEDYPGGTDEGRAMLQIIHDMAPKARLGFATAVMGEIAFADNIRSLAGFSDAPRTTRGFKADVIVDDVGYYDEPFFQDGISAHAVDEVAAAGVVYFSSAGNTPGSQAYDSDIRIVPGKASSWRGTNLDFSEVDPELYAGGFHNFAGRDGLDIAQTFSLLGAGILVFQWNEPFDFTPKLGRTIASGKGTLSEEDPWAFFTFAATAGQPVQIEVAADATGGDPLGDAVLIVYDPETEFVAFQDTGTIPETMIFVPDVTGTYTVVVEGFDGSTGDFTYRVREADVETVASDYNLLFFTEEGEFITGFAENNLATNRPIELSAISGEGNFQLVISRANTPARRAKAATRLRYVCDALAPQEYFDYLTPVTAGHPTARGAIGVGAYPDQPPYIPEYFTSPGPATIYFDYQGRPFRRPEVREKPDLSAMDGANNTFFGADSDGDGFPNFYGTSASAPHAAAIGALVLQAAGGPGKLSPGVIREILQESAFSHDLDPFYASGVGRARSGRVLLEAFGDDTGLARDPAAFRVVNSGNLVIASLAIDLSSANTTQVPRGLVFDERADAGMPLAIGSTTGIARTQIQWRFSEPAAPPAQTGQWKRVTFSFGRGRFAANDSFTFGVDRDEAATAVAGNSADLLGANFNLATGEMDTGGATFAGRFESGDAFAGLYVNRIGLGYTPVDGYGFVNAERAVRAAKRK